VALFFKQVGGITPRAGGGRLLDGRPWDEYPASDPMPEVARQRSPTIHRLTRSFISPGDGPDFRPLDLGWVRDLRDRCVSLRIPLFFKQIGGLTPKAGGRFAGRLDLGPVSGMNEAKTRCYRPHYLESGGNLP
jgi:protein gp37